MIHLRILTVFILGTLISLESQAQEEPFRIKTLVIDAGHGGKDPGNLGTGRYKTREKDIALDVAKRLGAYVKEQFPEIDVIYTRDTDVFIGLNERADIANSNKADLFISIHCNSIGYASARGVETFVLGLHKNEENLQIAMKENSAIFLEDDYETKYEGFDPSSPESIIALSMMQSAFLEQSLRISSYIQRQFKERVGRRDRGVKQAGFLVLRKTTMPSILIELGFLTNPEEEDFLNSESGRVYMASAILRGFKEYKEIVEDPLPETEKVETGGTEEKQEVSDDLRQAELKAELERKKAELAKKKGIDEKARQDSLDHVAEIEAARIKKELEEKKKAEEEAKEAAKAKAKAEKAEQERKAEEARIAEEQRKSEEARKAEDQRKAEEARKAEVARVAAEKAEADRIAAEKKKAEDERLAAEKAEQERWEQERRQAQLSAEIAAKAQAFKEAEEKAEAKRLAEEEGKAAESQRLAEKQAAQNQAAQEAIMAAEKAEAEKAAATKAQAEADEKARQEALKRIEAERLKREVMEAQKEEDERKQAEAEAAAKKAEEEKAAQQAQSAQLDEEAKRLAELKAKRAQIEARLEKLNEPKESRPTAGSTPVSSDATGVLFKIQIHTATKLLERSHPLFQGLNPEQYEQDGLYKYTVGNFSTMDEAGPMQADMRDRGFKGAFIVAFKNDERIKVSEARKLTENDGN